MPTGYLAEILGDDRTWDAAVPENAITGWPRQELANVAILNNSTTKTVTIDRINTRPLQGPQGTTPMIRWSRITALSDGTDVSVLSFDSNNTALPAQVLIKYAPTTITITANSNIRRQRCYTGMNIDRAMQRLCSRMTGSETTFLDFTCVGSWTDTSIQKTTYREGEGFVFEFDTDSGPNIFTMTVIFKNTATGETYYINKMIEPLFMANAPFLAFFNGAGSGAVYEVCKVQLREIGDDQIPYIDFVKINTCQGGNDIQVVWADSNDALPSGLVIKKGAWVNRVGYTGGGILSRPRFRTIILGESPWGVGTTSGPNIARRGKYSHDYNSQEATTGITLRAGEGIAVISRNPSGNMYCDFSINFTVTTISGGSGTFPADTDVRSGITYGPTGADYTGNIGLPGVGDVRLNISYGSNGTEATGTLVVGGGGGGGNRIFYPGGWG